MSAVILPELAWRPTTACSPRHGHPVTHVVVHRWGVRYTNEHDEASSYAGVIRYFQNAANKVSAHVVYPGSAVRGHAAQMVAWDHFAWAEAAYNPGSVEVEAADAIWLGHDPAGLHQLARIAAYLLHRYRLPAVWSHERGLCRHADLGAAGGGHTSCPTTDLSAWRQFVGLVQHEHQRGHFRPSWGR